MRFTELRDQLEAQWPAMQRNAHVVLHVPNLMPLPVAAPGEVGPPQRPEPLLIQAMMLREAAQLSRLCDLSEPLLDLILVLPSPPDPEVIHYWNKLLEVGGVRDPTSRYRYEGAGAHRWRGKRLRGEMIWKPAEGTWRLVYIGYEGC